MTYIFLHAKNLRLHLDETTIELFLDHELQPPAEMYIQYAYAMSTAYLHITHNAIIVTKVYQVCVSVRECVCFVGAKTK